jgi:hypothetical protein
LENLSVRNIPLLEVSPNPALVAARDEAVTQPKHYQIQTRSGSHYLLENGEPIARFNQLEKAEAARAGLVAKLAATYER